MPTPNELSEQLIKDESKRVLPTVNDWIYKKSARVYRKKLTTYFNSDVVLLKKISETYFLLAYLTHIDSKKNKNSIGKTRHSTINSIRDKVLQDLSFELVWRFVEILIDLSRYFQLSRRIIFQKDFPFKEVSYKCIIDKSILKNITLQSHNKFYPKPITTIPINWSFEDGKINGGYNTFQYELVRRAKDFPYSSINEKIFESLNYIQSTKWSVNVSLLKYIEDDLSVPNIKDYIKEELPDDKLCRWDLDLKVDSVVESERLSDKEKKVIQLRRDSYREKVELYNGFKDDYDSALAKYRGISLAIEISKEYIGKTIYFPHNYDYRGRIYPICVGLSPQGSDAVKAMLEYSNGEKLTQDGEDWCWAYLASLYGDDKLPFRERIERGKELLHTDYMEADEPYQFLAHQLEMEKYVNDIDYKVKARIHLDACNSGSQFTSALTGDKEGCIATNVIPTINKDGSQDRQDAYLLVKDNALFIIESEIQSLKEKSHYGGGLEEKDDANLEKLEYFKNLLEKHGRKICKRPVMVSNYGGTDGGRIVLILDVLRELDEDNYWITWKNANFFSKIIGEAIEGALEGGHAFEAYIHKVNNVLAKEGKAIFWTTSDGFNVRHIKYKEAKTKRVQLLLPSEGTLTISMKHFSKRVDVSGMKSAISPNYIHSLDAELLRRVALKMKEAGVKDTDWIHDSFGCHPNHVSMMLEITKKEFRKLIESNSMLELHSQFYEQARGNKVKEKLFEKIEIPNFNDGENNECNLDELVNSEWFFS